VYSADLSVGGKSCKITISISTYTGLLYDV
jgi:hypothetical protein